MLAAAQKAGERALLAQTSSQLAAILRYEAGTSGLKRPLALEPGCFGENLFLDGGEVRAHDPR